MRPLLPVLDVNTNVVKVSLRGKERLVTVVETYPFYKSTGTNSDYPNTWFPFHGFNVSGSGAMFAKLHANLDNLSWLANSPYELSKENELLNRFGGIDGICISYLMGGGFWDTEQGKTIGKALEEKYSSLIGDLKPKVSEIKKDLQSSASIPSFECTVSQIPIEQIKQNYDSLNNWLCQKSGREPFLVVGKTAYLLPEGKQKVSYEELFDKAQLSSVQIPVSSTVTVRPPPVDITQQNLTLHAQVADVSDATAASGRTAAVSVLNRDENTLTITIRDHGWKDEYGHYHLINWKDFDPRIKQIGTVLERYPASYEIQIPLDARDEILARLRTDPPTGLHMFLPKDDLSQQWVMTSGGEAEQRRMQAQTVAKSLSGVPGWTAVAHVQQVVQQQPAVFQSNEKEVMKQFFLKNPPGSGSFWHGKASSDGTTTVTMKELVAHALGANKSGLFGIGGYSGNNTKKALIGYGVDQKILMDPAKSIDEKVKHVNEKLSVAFSVKSSNILSL